MAVEEIGGNQCCRNTLRGPEKLFCPMFSGITVRRKKVERESLSRIEEMDVSWNTQ